MFLGLREFSDLYSSSDSPLHESKKPHMLSLQFRQKLLSLVTKLLITPHLVYQRPIAVLFAPVRSFESVCPYANRSFDIRHTVVLRVFEQQHQR